MPFNLPEHPDLEQLRTLARELARAYLAADPPAIERVATRLPAAPTPFRLAHAQTVIAREHGFSSWPRLKAAVERLREQPSGALVDTSSTGLRAFRKRPTREVASALIGLAQKLQLEDLVRALTLGRGKAIAVRDALLESGDLPKLVDALIIGARHHNPLIRAECAHAMDMFADERCATALLELLDDPVPKVRRNAVHAIACDESKIAPLQAVAGSRSSRGRDLVARVVDMALNDPSIQVRRHSTVALSMFTDVRATQAVETLLVREADEAIRRAALFALRRLRAE